MTDDDDSRDPIDVTIDWTPKEEWEDSLIVGEVTDPEFFNFGYIPTRNNAVVIHFDKGQKEGRSRAIAFVGAAREKFLRSCLAILLEFKVLEQSHDDLEESVMVNTNKKQTLH